MPPPAAAVASALLSERSGRDVGEAGEDGVGELLGLLWLEIVVTRGGVREMGGMVRFGRAACRLLGPRREGDPLDKGGGDDDDPAVAGRGGGVVMVGYGFGV